MARITCGFAGIDGAGGSYEASQLREAVAAGYSRAQYALANRALSGLLISTDATSTNVNAGELLSDAGVGLPEAENQLAKCEFVGCPDIPVDVPAAVTHAREAGERGVFDTLLEIGPQLQASQLDPDEVAAWSLIRARLEMQGYAGHTLNVPLVQSASSMLNSPTVTSHAKALTDLYWHTFGAQMLENLGCGTSSNGGAENVQFVRAVSADGRPEMCCRSDSLLFRAPGRHSPRV
jgi:hypothetical protein